MLDNKYTKEDKFYPEADKWMWHYCIFLGKFVGSDGSEYDLGIHVRTYKDKKYVSAAIVYGNTPGDYISGELDHFGFDGHSISSEYYEETRKRARELNLY